MKRLAQFLLLTLPISPVFASVLYSDGPVNGTYDAWTICCSFQVEDSFTLSGSSSVTGVTFGDWLYQGDTATSVQWAFVGSEGSQTPVCGTCSGVATVTKIADYGTNGFGFDVTNQMFSITGVTLAAGTYWLELQNGTTNDGDPQYWDMNGGPSKVWQSTYGDVSGSNCTAAIGLPAGACSNSFTILGGGKSSTPEPASLGLGLSALGLLAAGFIRRRKAS